VLNDLDWYLDNNIKLLLNRKVVEIDRVKRRVIAEDGTEAELRSPVDRHRLDPVSFCQSPATLCRV